MYCKIIYNSSKVSLIRTGDISGEEDERSRLKKKKKNRFEKVAQHHTWYL